MGELSKGFRQRVGLAEALVADPPVLILDEPTIGLDPTQIQEVRRLIRSLGGSHTVLLSSHILPEVEKTCSNLVIIAGGRIAAAGSVEELKVGLAAATAWSWRSGPAAPPTVPPRWAASSARCRAWRRRPARTSATGWSRFTATAGHRGRPARGPLCPGGAAGLATARDAPRGADARGTVGPGHGRRRRGRRQVRGVRFASLSLSLEVRGWPKAR